MTHYEITRIDLRVQPSSSKALHNLLIFFCTDNFTLVFLKVTFFELAELKTQKNVHRLTLNFNCTLKCSFFTEQRVILTFNDINIFHSKQFYGDNFLFI